ncbi:MAG: pilin [bacterium]|nr:pilin [bacterium]
MTQNNRTQRTTSILLGLLVAVVAVLATVSPTFAQTVAPGTGQIEGEGFVQCTSTFPSGESDAEGVVGGSCDLCDLLALVNNATTYAVAFVTIISIVFIFVSGFLYLSSAGDEAGRIAQAKTTLKFAITGFVFAILSLIIVKTIFVVLFGQGAGLGTIQCQITEAAPGPGTGAPGTGTEQPGTGEPPPTDEISDQEARQRLAAGGVSVKDGISFAGVKTSTIDGAIAFKKECGCNVTITSATEGDHAEGVYSHGNGYKIDYRLLNTTTNYIENTYTYIGNRSGDGAALYKDPRGNIYAKEGNHWDVAYCYGACTGGLAQ